jgi:precorrin-8X/cobalt-precorrin-8 methylmutase
MTFDYISSPQTIEQQSFKQIRQLTNLDGLSEAQQQVAMRIVHSTGMPEIVKQLRFSERACHNGMQSLANNMPILCDVEMVRQGVTRRLLKQAPYCFLNDERTIRQAKKTGETRSMAALELWKDVLQDSVVIIGNAPTALFRLLEMIEETQLKPALIIGMPVGFVGAAESKQALWEAHHALGVECMTLLGRQGGSAVSAAACNALLRCNVGEIY